MVVGDRCVFARAVMAGHNDIVLALIARLRPVSCSSELDVGYWLSGPRVYGDNAVPRSFCLTTLRDSFQSAGCWFSGPCVDGDEAAPPFCLTTPDLFVFIGADHDRVVANFEDSEADTPDHGGAPRRSAAGVTPLLRHLMHGELTVRDSTLAAVGTLPFWRARAALYEDRDCVAADVKTTEADTSDRGSAPRRRERGSTALEALFGGPLCGLGASLFCAVLVLCVEGWCFANGRGSVLVACEANARGWFALTRRGWCVGCGDAVAPVASWWRV